MESPDEYSRAILNMILADTDVQYLGLSDPQLLSFACAASWYMGGSRESVNGVAIEPDTEAENLTIVWIANEAIGALTIPKAQDAGMPPITGWLRPVSDVLRLEVHAEVQVDSFSNEVEVRPTVKIHLDGGGQVVVSADKPNERSRKQARDFIVHLKRRLESRGEG